VHPVAKSQEEGGGFAAKPTTTTTTRRQLEECGLTYPKDSHLLSMCALGFQFHSCRSLLQQIRLGFSSVAYQVLWQPGAKQ
jgi:hypothetical protein